MKLLCGAGNQQFFDKGCGLRRLVDLPGIVFGKQDRVAVGQVVQGYIHMQPFAVYIDHVLLLQAQLPR